MLVVLAIILRQRGSPESTAIDPSLPEGRRRDTDEEAESKGTRVAPTQQPTDAYNYGHFRTKHFLADLRTTLRGGGVRAGEAAPDFDLEATDGGRLRLGDLRGAPVLLHFGSLT